MSNVISLADYRDGVALDGHCLVWRGYRHSLTPDEALDLAEALNDARVMTGDWGTSAGFLVTSDIVDAGILVTIEGWDMGPMSLKLKIKIDARGVAGIVHEINSKLPKDKKVASTMWVTAGGNLTPENPRQQSLNLREVPATETVNFDPETGEVRSL